MIDGNERDSPQEFMPVGFSKSGPPTGHGASGGSRVGAVAAVVLIVAFAAVLIWVVPNL